MIALDLVKSLSAEGVEFSTDGVRIRWRNGDGLVTADVIAALAAEKAAIIDFLAGENSQAGTDPAASDPEDLQAELKERAAILECDAGLSREEAERQAAGVNLSSKLDISERTAIAAKGDLRRDMKFDPAVRPGDPETYVEALRVHGPMTYGMAMRVLGWGGTRAGQAETALRAAGRITLNNHGRAVLTGAQS
ncbi:hypothetical protein ATER59S_05048 [Aquamicrobium terrae]